MNDATAAPKSTAMIEYGRGGIGVSTFEEAWRLAQLFAKSDLVPKDYREKPENCLVAMQMGAELGFKPMQSIQGIAVINGRPSVWGDALWALVQSSPLVENCHEEFDSASMTATCTIKRKGRSAPTVHTFSQPLAVKAGLWGKQGPWTQYPTRMLQMRARAFCARDALPDVLKGLAVAEDMQDIVEIDMGDAQVVHKPAATQVTTAEARAALPAMADEAFAKNMTAWNKAVADKKIAPQQIIQKVLTRNTLTDAQKKAIEDIGKTPPSDVGDVEERARMLAADKALADEEGGAQ